MRFRCLPAENLLFPQSVGKGRPAAHKAVTSSKGAPQRSDPPLCCFCTLPSEIDRTYLKGSSKDLVTNHEQIHEPVRESTTLISANRDDRSMFNFLESAKAASSNAEATEAVGKVCFCMIGHSAVAPVHAHRGSRIVDSSWG